MRTNATQHPPGDTPSGPPPGSKPIEPDEGPGVPTVPPTPEGEPVPEPKV